jgi:hypothetical protein
LTVLFALYPKEKAVSYTKEGDKMRLVVALAVALHIVFFIGCVVEIGFYSSAMNLALALWSFSLYLTLDTWKIFLYIIFMIGCLTFTIMVQFVEFEWNLKFGGLILNTVFYILLIVLILKTYMPFSASGGIYGITGSKGSNSHQASASKLFDKACKGLKKGELWIDEKFPANIDSIRGNAKDQSSMPNIEAVCDGWRRATDFDDAEESTPLLFKDGISPNDVA